MSEAYQERRKTSDEDGKRAQNEFEKAAEIFGFYVIRASGDQDMFQHWDRMIIQDPFAEFVDVKAMKDVHASGYTWIEHQNKFGNDGWLRGKELKYPRTIAFENHDCFDIVDVHELRKLIDAKVDWTKPILRNRVELSYMIYRQYCRSGNDDRLILTPYADIVPLVNKKLYKDGRLERIISVGI
jgi:hypothetical protein